MSTPYTLVYFDIRGRAEPIRLLLNYAHVPFEDRGLKGEEWGRFKPETPLGRLPVLIEHRPEGDRMIPESMAILRHLARKHGLDGKTDDERLAADVAAEATIDLRGAFTALRFSPAWADEAAKAKYIQETAPLHFTRLDKLLGDRAWLAASAPTYADLLMYEALSIHRLTWLHALERFPRLAAFVGRVEALPELSDYLPRRRAG